MLLHLLNKLCTDPGGRHAQPVPAEDAEVGCFGLHPNGNCICLASIALLFTAHATGW